MKTGIFYATNHGSTKKVAEIIKEQMGTENVDLINLKESKNPQIDDYNTIIIGGSIHAGKVQKQIKSFYNKNLDTLKNKKVGLYLCCMMEEKSKEQFDNAFSKDIQDISVSNKIIGGEFDFEKMNFIEKAIIKKVAKVDKSVSTINNNKITELVSELK